ncbi:hypothetical protein [Maridesulfovibrio ferrireducens]|uniref:hypothetical protein n=1 Tax=Maridesulfovibrio ferrireducens TaxID=246191 RepID=UPI001A1F64A1|nr:hypothetical protein [Maridesulfovibrio ferrireducens]MBI9110255.1 hypothetical protein [Maridesulfovibrio ferrireducens]
MSKRKKCRKAPRICPHCGNTVSGSRCHSPVCVQLRIVQPMIAKDWTMWTMPALLARMVGKAIVKQGVKDGDKPFAQIGERLHKWTNQACDESQQFKVSPQYAIAQQTKYDREVVKIWPHKSNIELAHIADVLQLLVADVIQHFKAKGYSDKQLKCWNWTEAALTALQRHYDEDEILKHCDRIEQDYTAFKLALWNESTALKKPALKMWNVSDRFAVAAYAKDEALKIVKKHYGLIKLSASRLVPEAKIEYNGKVTTYGMLLELFACPGIVADMREAA